MKAVRYYGIHDVRLEEIDKPIYSGDQVLIKVNYAGICGSDLHIYNQGMFIQNIPETMGHEFVGTIEEVGNNVKEFKTGDIVIANPMVSCMKCDSCKEGSYNTCSQLGFIGEVRQGCFAEYISMDQNTLIKVPKNSDLSEIALSEPLAVAMNICHRADFKHGDKVALIGVGPIGLLTVMVAKSLYGVDDITAVDVSEVRLNLAEVVGARKTYKILPEELKFDKVIEAAGQPITFKLAMNHVKCNGSLYVVSIFEKDVDFDVNGLVSSQINLVGCNVYTHANLREAVDAISTRAVDVTPLISRKYNLDGCREAFNLLCSKDKSVAKVLFEI